MATIMSTSSAKGTIKSLNGIRVITISWVIVGHIYMALARAPLGKS